MFNTYSSLLRITIDIVGCSFLERKVRPFFNLQASKPLLKNSFKKSIKALRFDIEGGAYCKK
jgi:hypothetical protein